jgi:hypothetical protein
MVETNHLLCSKAVAVPAPKVEVNDTDSKDKLVAALKEFFDFCSNALAKMDDSKLAETTEGFGGKQVTRLVEPGPGRHLGRPLRRNCNVSSLERPVAADCQEIRYEASVTERV